MKLSTVVFTLVVLTAVLVKSGEANASPLEEELLDELNERLLSRYLESKEQDKDVQNTNTRDRYEDGPVRRLASRWWNWPTQRPTQRPPTPAPDNTDKGSKQDCKK